MARRSRLPVRVAAAHEGMLPGSAGGTAARAPDARPAIDPDMASHPRLIVASSAFAAYAIVDTSSLAFRFRNIGLRGD
jgi:hypothetical protein